MRAVYHPLDWIMLLAAVAFFVFCAARYSGGMAAVNQSAPAATITNDQASNQ